MKKFENRYILLATTAFLPFSMVARERPNMVIFVADDLLSTELSCYGGQNLLTPHIDRLAREGLKFNHCYTSTAMSVPARASLYTGLYPAHNGSWANHKDTFLGTKTVCEYMAQEGYRVGRTGKNHPINPDVYHFEEVPGFTVPCTAKKAPYDTEGIKEFIGREDPRPFVLFVCSIHPHAPWTWGDPGEFDANKLILPRNYVDNPQMREIYTHYLAEVRALDNELGSVMEVLEERGELDNTVLMFLGEQGPQFPGGKWTCWYPGVHSATLVRYPKKIKAGTETDALVQYEDILPTLIDLAGGSPRKELDGKSFKKVLFGKKREHHPHVFAIHNNFTPPSEIQYPIRSIRDRRYALIWNLLSDKAFYRKAMTSPEGAVWSAWMGAKEKDPQAAFWIDRYLHRPEFEFYDLENDPWERVNLIHEPQHQGRIESMKKELEKWMKTQGDTGHNLDQPFVNRPK